MKGEAVTVQARGQARTAPSAVSPPRDLRPSHGPPTHVRFAWFGLGAIAMVVALCALARSEAALAALEEDDASPVATTTASAIVFPTMTAAPLPPPKPPTAPPAELAAAGRDPLALSALSDRYPADAEVLKALFLAHASDKK